MIDWKIQPLTGVGPLTFGATYSQVNGVIGPPRFEKKYGPTDFRQSRGINTAGYDVILGYDPDKLVHATFPSQINDFSVLGSSIFSVNPDYLLPTLKQANGGYYEIYTELFTFERLGIVLSDWLDPDSDVRWLGAGSESGYRIMIGDDEPDETVT